MNARPSPDILRPILHVPANPAQDIPVHDARRLTGPGGQARILLDGQTYALRITRQGKLILTK